MSSRILRMPNQGQGFGMIGDPPPDQTKDPLYVELQTALARVQALPNYSAIVNGFIDPGYSYITNATNFLAQVADGTYTIINNPTNIPYAQSLISGLNAIGPASSPNTMPPQPIYVPIDNPPEYLGPPITVGDAEPVARDVPGVVPVSLPVSLDPNTGMVAVVHPDTGEVVVGAGQVNNDGSVTVTTQNGGTLTGAPATVQQQQAATLPSANSPISFINSLEAQLTTALTGVATQLGVSVTTVEVGGAVLIGLGLWKFGIFDSLLGGGKRR